MFSTSSISGQRGAPIGRRMSRQRSGWDSVFSLIGPESQPKRWGNNPVQLVPDVGFLLGDAERSSLYAFIMKCWSVSLQHKLSINRILRMASCTSNGLSSISSGLIKLRKTNHYFIFPRSADGLETWISAKWRWSTSLCRSCNYNKFPPPDFLRS